MQKSPLIRILKIFKLNVRYETDLDLKKVLIFKVVLTWLWNRA